MTITFKDVGQGDSIIIEWIDGASEKIGIIDCNKKGRKNPVVNHLKKGSYKEIEFIILTHPHRDHYSGLLELLEFADEKGVIINKVAHTLTATHHRYWKYFEVSNKDTRQLSRIISKFKSLRKKGVIKMMDVLSKGVTVKIDGTTALECLSPSHDEIEEYVRLVRMNADENPKEASQAANFLSTIFRLKQGNSYLLFTSDAESMAFDSIVKRREYEFGGHLYILCQLPHHGSESNHHEGFWKLIEINPGSHAAISAGEHRNYNHPSFSVVKGFHDMGYVVNCTNVVNGMTEFNEFVEKQKIDGLMLDYVSSIASEYVKSNDRIYLVDNDSVSLLN